MAKIEIDTTNPLDTSSLNELLAAFAVGIDQIANDTTLRPSMSKLDGIDRHAMAAKIAGALATLQATSDLADQLNAAAARFVHIFRPSLIDGEALRTLLEERESEGEDE